MYQPGWQRKTTLIQKDPEKGNAASKYHIFACLPLMWKLLTSVLAKKKYMHIYLRRICYWISTRDAGKTLKEWRINSWDKKILKHCKKHQRNLAMVYIDYRNAYDMVPHCWMIEAMVGNGRNCRYHCEYISKQQRDMDNRADSMQWKSWRSWY